MESIGWIKAKETCRPRSGFRGATNQHMSVAQPELSAVSRESRCSLPGARRRALMNQLETYDMSVTMFFGKVVRVFMFECGAIVVVTYLVQSEAAPSA